MPLLAFLESNPDAIEEMSLAQIISACGNGKLTDDSECSKEFRHYTARATSKRLCSLVEACLTPSEKFGYALQDLVNELGRRLDLKIEHGRYQGVRGVIGFDGLWMTSTGHAIVVEAKTTDAYRINLDTVANYRQKLIDEGRISRQSSILIVVLREDTGDLEAQVRGSRHAWDIRIISVDALIKLLTVKEQTEAKTQRQIERLLVPFEYTKLDRIIDIAFTAISELDPDPLSDEQPPISQIDVAGEVDRQHGKQARSPQALLNAVRERAVETLAEKRGFTPAKKSIAKYASAGDETAFRIVCATSKIYDDGGCWYALHPNWCDFMAEGKSSVFALTGIGLGGFFAIPFSWIQKEIDHLWNTERSDSRYWHIVIRQIAGRWVLMRRDPNPPLPIDQFWVSTEKAEVN